MRCPSWCTRRRRGKSRSSAYRCLSAHRASNTHACRHCIAPPRPDTGALPPRRTAAILVTTTNTLQDRKIKDYVGIVSDEAILGANIFKDLFASIRDIVGGRSKAYEEEL